MWNLWSLLHWGPQQGWSLGWSLGWSVAARIDIWPLATTWGVWRSGTWRTWRNPFGAAISAWCEKYIREWAFNRQIFNGSVACFCWFFLSCWFYHHQFLYVPFRTQQSYLGWIESLTSKDHLGVKGHDLIVNAIDGCGGALVMTPMGLCHSRKRGVLIGDQFSWILAYWILTSQHGM